MFNNPLPEYSQIKIFQQKLRKAKRNYLTNLVSLGYVLLQKGTYSDTQYWAIHPDYYLTDDERWDSDQFIIDGTISPECYPKGAFILIDSIVESETEDWFETEYLLYEDRCSIDYLYSETNF